MINGTPIIKIVLANTTTSSLFSHHGSIGLDRHSVIGLQVVGLERAFSGTVLAVDSSVAPNVVTQRANEWIFGTAPMMPTGASAVTKNLARTHRSITLMTTTSGLSGSQVQRPVATNPSIVLLAQGNPAGTWNTKTRIYSTTIRFNPFVWVKPEIINSNHSDYSSINQGALETVCKTCHKAETKRQRAAGEI
jgi:hypothetical protein